ncbi:MAG: cation diffusion facilitator family transporter [Sulfolobales archaeon]
MPKNRKEAGYKEGVVSVIVNLSLFILKYVLGITYNSVAVIADAIHTLSDALTSGVVVLSFWIAYKPADKEHPFGHGRAEHVGSIIIGTLLFVAGYELLLTSFNKLMMRESLTFNLGLVAVMFLSATIKEILTRWSLRLGHQYGADILVSDAWHHRTDAVASLLVGLGVVVGEKLWWVDGVLGLGVSFLIIYIAFKLVVTTSKEFLGHSPSPTLENDVRKVISSISEKVSDVHHMHIHKYGEHVEVTLHIRLPPNTPLSEAHRIATQIEKELKDRYSWEVTVHVEPAESKAS